MNWQIHRREKCRICESRDLQRFLHFARMPFTDQFVSKANLGQEFRADLDVFFCKSCRTAQTLHDVEVTEYYRDYRYTVSSSGFARRFMERLAEETVRRFGLRSGDSVLEIGSGDGHQLLCFKKLGCRVLGFEPSADLTQASREIGVDVAQCLFNSDSIGEIPSDMQPAQAVLLTYTFDHLPEPLPFLKVVSQVLDPKRGVLVIEVHDIERILERKETCLFEHEHTIYLSRLSMKRLLERAGFKLLTTELLPESERRGNSLLIVAARPEAIHEPDASTEHNLPTQLDEWAAYSVFEAQVSAAYEKFRTHVRSLRAAGKRVAGYGAGGRGVMTLAMAQLTADEVEFLGDQNPSFDGLYTPVTHIPVVSPERLIQEQLTDIIVFSYGYIAEIRASLAKHEARGGRFVSLLDLLK